MHWWHTEFTSKNETEGDVIQHVIYFVNIGLLVLVQTLVFLTCNNLKIKINKFITLPVELYGCKTRYFTLREKLRLKVIENRILRRIFRPKSDENGECPIMMTFIVCTVHLLQSG